MKTRLNILSVLILFIFIYAIGYEIYVGATDFRQSFRKGYSDAQIFPLSQPDLGEKYFLKLLLDTDRDLPVDSVFSKKTGEYYPVEYTSVGVYSKKDYPKHLLILLPFLGILSLVVLPLLVICFWKIISSVKKSRIFEKSNITKLRVMGLCFCLLAFVAGSMQLMELYEAEKFLEIEGYSIARGEWFSSSFWIYGLISFLVAEIFAIGLKMKEEQELTI